MDIKQSNIEAHIASLKASLRTKIATAKESHKRIFQAELADGELNMFFSGLLEFKRRKWVESSLGDHGPEELLLMLDILDEAEVKKD